MLSNRQSIYFFLMRHAKTLWNEQKRMQGRRDISLSKRGEIEAHEWAKKLQQFSFDCILSSPLKRATETATIINEYLNIEIKIDERLKEQNLGLWEGKKIKDVELEATHLLDEIGGDGWKFCPPQGEHRLSVLGRVKEVLVHFSKERTDENILVVTHQGPIKFLIYNILQRKFIVDESKIIIPNNVHSISYKGCDLKIESLNHLSLSH